MSSLRHNGNFVRLFLGRLVTNAGDSLYLIAALWLVHELGGSPFLTGLAGFLTLLPSALQFLTGPFVDRWPIRRLLVVVQVIQAVFVLLIPLAQVTGHLNVALVIVVIPILAMLNQFVYPAQNAALPRIVSQDNIVRANSAFSFAYHGVDAVFKAVGGILIASLGSVSLYLFDSATFGIAALLFASVSIPSAKTETEQDEETSSVQKYIDDLREGFEYVYGTVVSRLIVTAIIGNFALQMSTSVLPVFSDLRGGPKMYGAMLSALAAGMLVGSLVASFLEDLPFGAIAITANLVGCVCWLTAVHSSSRRVTILLFALAWIPVGVHNVLVHSTVQTVVPDDLVGRAMSLTSGVSAASGPVGALVGGIVADVWGSVVAMSLSGIGLLFVALYFWFRPSLRRLSAVTDLETLHSESAAD